MEEQKGNGILYRLLRFLKGKKSNQDNASQNVVATNISNTTIIQIGNVTADEGTLEKICEAVTSKQPAILGKLLEEKAEECRDAVLKGDIEKAKSICQAVCISAFEGCNNDIRKKFQFYRFLLSVITKEEVGIRKQCEEVLSEEYVEIASFISGLFNNVQSADIKNLTSYNEEVQVCVLDILFTNGQFDRICDLYKSLSTSGVELSFFWFYYTGLSLFNQSNYEEAQILLEKAYTNKRYVSLVKHDSIKIYSMIAKIMDVTIRISQGKCKKEQLEDVYNKYKEFKSSCEDFDKAIEGNKAFVVAIELQTILNINVDNFWDAYNSSDLEVRKSAQVINLLGTYYERINDQKNVFDTYSQLDWRHEDVYLFKLMYSRLSEQNYKDILRLYDDADEIAHSARVRGLRLVAIKEINPREYNEQFLKELENCNEDIEQIFAISLSLKAEEGNMFNEIIYPKVKRLLPDILISADNVKVGYAGLFLNYGYATDSLEVLDSLQVPAIIDDTLAMEFYHDLYYYKDSISEQNNITHVLLDDESPKEKVADWFISHGILVPSFLTVKINCLYDRNKWLSALEHSKNLYDLTNDETVAANIISLLHQVKSDDSLSYEKYASILSYSSKPRSLMASAVAYEAVGKYTEADLQSYKALYVLNEKEDYEIYDSYFSLHNSMLAKHNDDIIDKNIVSGNVVVKLKLNIDADTINMAYEGEQYLDVCLDSENWTEEYGLERNHSFGIEHYGSKDSLYLWLQGKRRGDEVEYQGKKYCIIEIIDRNFYCSKYVFNKVIEGREQSSIPITTIQFTNIEDLKKQFMEFENSDARKNASQARENLINMYHHKKDFIGIPIEAINSCNYEEYLELVGELLYLEDQALYSGNAVIYSNYDGKYVLTISSLAVMSQLSVLDVLQKLSDEFVVPQSVKMLIKKQIEGISEQEQISPGKLHTSSDGNMTLIKRSPEIFNMWKKMYEICEGIESVEVTDIERAEFKLLGNYDAEALFMKTKCDICQMDALIIAQRENAIVVLDDFFFRIISEASGIHVTNFTFMLYQIEREQAAEIAMNMSKTNYITTPLIYLDVESGKKFWNNLLKGKIKRQIYGRQFSSLHQKDLFYTTNETGQGNYGGLSTVMEMMD